MSITADSLKLGIWQLVLNLNALLRSILGFRFRRATAWILGRLLRWTLEIGRGGFVGQFVSRDATGCRLFTAAAASSGSFRLPARPSPGGGVRSTAVLDSKLNTPTARSQEQHLNSTSSLTTDMVTAIAVALVQSRLDYANSLLYRVSTRNIHKLQRYQNTAARLILQQSFTPSIQDLMNQLH